MMNAPRVQRWIGVLFLVIATGLCVIACAGPARPGKKVIIIGIDGMDPGLLREFMGEGRLPHVARLAAEGDFRALQTTMPPLSPVAWSSFITGLDPGGHAIFDFLHRDPQTIAPYDSIYRVGSPGRTLNLGSWVLPLTGGRVELLRKGRAFWEILEDAGVETTVFRMPVNFPPVDAGGRSLSGMGTPDLLGTHGTFSFYTSDPPDTRRTLAGGVIRAVDVIDNHVHARLVGPENTFRRIQDEHPDLLVDFDAYLDPDTPAVKLVVQDTAFVLEEGEWSDWVPIVFEAIPYAVRVNAAARFYLQGVRPAFKLYVSPLQIDPASPSLPISTPDGWSADLSEALGRFYTQELPEDTKAFREGIFTGDEFWEQSQFVYRENLRALDHVLASFDDGLLFFYFGSVDQGSHMLYHYRDPAHPAYVSDANLVNGMRTLYEQMDDAVGRVLKAADSETTVIVMSDHGFAPFYRGVNLNSWLVEKGYMSVRGASSPDTPFFPNVDWTSTTAYAVGLQGLYVNVRGREANGVVTRGPAYDALLDRLERDLLAMRDPLNGQQPVTLVYRTARELGGQHTDLAPDIVVGYNRGYRSSWESPLGGLPREVFVDNTEAWSGDHSIDYRLVPGVLLTNRRITLSEPAIVDLTVAVLDEFGVAPLAGMIGRDCLAESR